MIEVCIISFFKWSKWSKLHLVVSPSIHSDIWNMVLMVIGLIRSSPSIISVKRIFLLVAGFRWRSLFSRSFFGFFNLIFFVFIIFLLQGFHKKLLLLFNNNVQLFFVLGLSILCRALLSWSLIELSFKIVNLRSRLLWGWTFFKMFFRLKSTYSSKSNRPSGSVF